MTLFEAIRESNRIEGILRDPTQQEINEHRRFLELERVTVPELCAFVKVYQPNAVLRDRPGLDVRVGNHVPPAGGAAVPLMLDAILEAANSDKYTPWNIHLEYETLHPFTDGNGRSGRMLWYWMMVGNRQADLGFLHAFYYQTLRYAKR